MSLFGIPVSKKPCRAIVKKYFIRELMDFVGISLMELWRNIKLEIADPETPRKFSCWLYLKSRLIRTEFSIVTPNDKVSHRSM